MGPISFRHEACAARVTIAVLFAAVLAPAVHAQVNYGIAAGVGETDNVTLVSSDKISQTMAIADADFDVKEMSRRFDVAAKGDFSYIDYLQNAYGSQLIGRFDGIADVSLVPERFMWVVRDDFGQAALDPFTPVTPNNLEKVNYVSTGPDLHMRLGSSNFFNLSARYARADYQTSPFNSNRGLGEVAVGRDLSANSTLSLNGEGERVMFENTAVNTDFDRYSAYGRYDVQGARTQLAAELGATTIRQANEDTNGVLAKFLLTRKLSAAGTLTLSAGRILTDASTSFSNLQLGPIARPGAASVSGLTGAAIGALPSGFITFAPSALTSQSYTDNYASTGWGYVRNRTSFSIRAFWEKDTYPYQPALDVTTPGVDLQFKRRLTSSLTAQLIGRAVKTDYINAQVATQSGSSNYKSILLGGSLTWWSGRGLQIVCRYDHNAWIVSGPGNGYNENRVVVMIGYRPHQSAESPADLQP